MANLKVSVASLGTPDKEGWMTKQGGSIKTWKKRWFVLKGDMLYYFKTQKDAEQTGEIKLDNNCKCQPEPSLNKKKNRHYFSVYTPVRVYLMYCDSEDVMNQWVSKIQSALKGVGSSPSATSSTPEKKPDPTPVASPTPEKKSDPTPSSGGEMSPRVKIGQAKNVIPFLQDEDSKVLEFWQIWSESIPPGESEDLQVGMNIEYHVSTSANMQKLTWRTAGPQNIFIQKMVDFFWNVGAPESEIDRLNDVGALINPIKIGSWIDMSAKGGMDGGWYFPVDIPLKMAIEAADPGDPSKKVTDWAERHNVEKSFSVGRDMGAAPPRQTEIRVRLPGADAAAQITVGLDAFTSFGFPPLPETAVNVLKDTTSPGVCLSVITSSEGFVRLGLLSPNPSKDTVQKLCGIAGANGGDLQEFQRALGSEGPAFAEYQFLKEGFGYGVYKEGFDIVFHFNVGTEGPSE